MQSLLVTLRGNGTFEEKHFELEFDQEHILCHDDSVPETFNPQASTSPNRCENNDTVLNCDTIELIKTINPTTDFPIPSHEIWNISRCDFFLNININITITLLVTQVYNMRQLDSATMLISDPQC